EDVTERGAEEQLLLRAQGAPCRGAVPGRAPAPVGGHPERGVLQPSPEVQDEERWQDANEEHVAPGPLAHRPADDPERRREQAAKAERRLQRRDRPTALRRRP